MLCMSGKPAEKQNRTADTVRKKFGGEPDVYKSVGVAGRSVGVEGEPDFL